MPRAAAVLLLFTAFFDFWAGLGYLAGGTLTAGMGGVVRSLGDAAQEHQSLGDAGTRIAAAGGGVAFFGIFLLITVGLLVAASVALLKGVRPHTVYVGCGAALICEVVGALVLAVGITNLLGLTAAVLGSLAARRIQWQQHLIVLADQGREAPPDRVALVLWIAGIALLGIALVLFVSSPVDYRVGS